MRHTFLQRSFLALAAVGLCAGCTKPVAPAASQADVKYAQVGDVKLAYYIRGEGKLLLMIDGYISTMKPVGSRSDRDGRADRPAVDNRPAVDRVLAAANPAGSQGVPADKAVEDKLNDPNISDDQKLALLFPRGRRRGSRGGDLLSDPRGGETGIGTDDFTVSKETALRQNRARTTLWDFGRIRLRQF